MKKDLNDLALEEYGVPYLDLPLDLRSLVRALWERIESAPIASAMDAKGKKSPSYGIR